MKATGIVRRIDDLGRIVIPKEIRRSMRIQEGDALEIFTSEEGITFRKYRTEHSSELEGLADQLYEQACSYTRGDERRQLTLNVVHKLREAAKEIRKIEE